MSISTAHESTVNSFYLAYFGRPADPAGLAFWTAQVAVNGGDTRAIAVAFAHSEEATARYGNASPSALIDNIYQQLFNRAPDSAGLRYWTDAIVNGHASSADIVIAILNGAQGSDLQLSELRQKAVSDFTFWVGLGGSGYSGDAALEAARTLVRAVTLDASASDIARAVDAAVSLADAATGHPDVIAALAAGGSLAALFDTARGLADPVPLIEAMAELARAAAGNPSTLETLLRGGGMAQVLQVMPATATLQDLVNALAKGGLAGAIEVVYPPVTDTPPAAGVTLAFLGVTQGPLDSKDDAVTNQQLVDVKFGYSGDLRADQRFQYSTDGVSWTDIAASGRVITIAQLDLLALGSAGGIVIMGAMGDLVTNVQVRVVDASNHLAALLTQSIVYDTTRPAGALEFVRIEGKVDGVLVTDQVRANVTVNIDALDDGIVQWRLEGQASWSTVTAIAGNGNFTLAGIDLSQDDQRLEVRVIDAAGNVGDQRQWNIDGPAGFRLTLSPTVNGLEITSSVNGAVEIGGAAAATTHASNGVVAGQIVMLGQQTVVRTGQLKIAPASGPKLDDASGRSYGFGTALSDTSLSGNYLWGYGGDDVLNGTIGDDYLFGGEGDDVINSNGGQDSIAGNAGADRIQLVVDGLASRIGYLSGDTQLGVFSNGASVAQMDVITGAEAGDTLFISSATGLATAQVGDQYLTSGASGQVAVVRGDLTAGNFSAAPSGVSYLVQWTDGSGINSVLVEDYAGVLNLRVDPHTRSLTLVDAPPPPSPVASTYTHAGFGFTAQWSKFSLYGNPADVVLANTGNGLLDASGLQLTDLRPGAGPTTGYLDGANLGVDIHGHLTLNKVLVAGVYELAWTEGSFATASGVFGAGSTRFAGGVDGAVVQQGFALGATTALTGGRHDASGSAVSTLYVPGNDSTVLITGDGYDAVLAGHGTVDLHYARLDLATQDLIVRFGYDDHISLAGHAGAQVDKDASGVIDWKTGAQVVVNAATEGVYMETLGGFVSDELNLAGSATLLNLNLHLDVTGAIQGDSALILVKELSGRGGALLQYVSANDNGVVDAGEVTLVAVFTQGVPDIAQITLVGVSG